MTKDELICAVSTSLLYTIKPELPGVIIGYDKETDVINIFDEITKSLVAVGMPGICSAFMEGAGVDDITEDLSEAYFTLITTEALTHAFARNFPNVILAKSQFEPLDPETGGNNYDF